ncbi:MAG: hypothetical protein HDT08_00930 [Bacteroidales bacterium]|nr:hypothetical protein [Bacteroidales bacterium]
MNHDHQELSSDRSIAVRSAGRARPSPIPRNFPNPPILSAMALHGAQLPPPIFRYFRLPIGKIASLIKHF